MRCNRTALVAVGMLALGVAGFGASSASAEPTPTPEPSATTFVPVPPGSFVSEKPQVDRSLPGIDPVAVQQGKANEAFLKGISPPTARPTPRGASGHAPYGGQSFTTRTTNGQYVGCSTGIATVASNNSKWIYDAGHCQLDDNTGTPDVDPNLGHFWFPKGYEPAPGFLNIGDRGHVSLFDSLHGDRGFIRPNLISAPPLYREVKDFTGAVFSVPAGGNPLQGENIQMLSNFNDHRLSGYVYDKGPLCWTMEGGRQICNLALGYFDYAYNDNRCAEDGDSGAPMVNRDTKQFTGVLSASLVDTYNGTQRCWVWWDRAGTTLTSVGQVLAPLRPVP
jgi:hypothetical protein